MIKIKQEDYSHYTNNIFKNSPWYTFMNHGYFPSSDKLDSKYILKNSATLYLKLIEGLETTDRTILDIGCGRGGGPALYKQFFEFKEIHGCEINEDNLKFCINTHEGVLFKLGSSQSLTYENNYFDIITCVESMHCYENKKLFLTEAKRVLSPKGTLCITDVISHHLLAETSNAVCNSGIFGKIEELDITPIVLSSCYDFLENSLPLIEDTTLNEFLTDIFIRKIKAYEEKIIFYKMWRCFN